MNAGKQRHLVGFYSKSQTPDGGGGYTETPILVRPVWGSAEVASATDAIVSQQIEGRQRITFICPYYSDITDTTLVAWWLGHWYRIVGPPKNKDFQNRELAFVLEELQATSPDRAV